MPDVIHRIECLSDLLSEARNALADYSFSGRMRNMRHETYRAQFALQDAMTELRAIIGAVDSLAR